MRYLITGGCGFLGSNLAAECLRRGHQLTVLDSLVRQGASENLAWLKSQGEFRFVKADIRDRDTVANLVAETQPEVVFHLAGQVAMTTSLADPRMDFEINALGTLNVLEAIRLHSPESVLLYSSTNKVYGDLLWTTYTETATRYRADSFPNGFPESIPLSFHSPYGCSKGSADQYVLDYARLFGLRSAVFRHSSMYGGRQYSTVDQGWIGWFCQKAIEIKTGRAREPFTICGNGKQVRDLLHAEDMVSLYYTAAEQIDQVAGEAFNIGGGPENSLSLLELFAFLEQELGIQMAYRQLPPRASDQLVFTADISRAQRMLGWKPRVSAPEGLRNVLNWVQTTLLEEVA